MTSGGNNFSNFSFKAKEENILATRIFSPQNGGHLKSAALFGRTVRTCLRPALVIAPAIK